MVVTYQLVGACGGGGHIRLDVSIDGGAPQRLEIEIDGLRGAIGEEQREAFLIMLLRAAISGLSRSDARTKLQAGITLVL